MERHQSNRQLRTVSSSSVPPAEHTLTGINHDYPLSLGEKSIKLLLQQNETRPLESGGREVQMEGKGKLYHRKLPTKLFTNLNFKEEMKLFQQTKYEK